jgi:hypothetical protein
VLCTFCHYSRKAHCMAKAISPCVKKLYFQHLVELKSFFGLHCVALAHFWREGIYFRHVQMDMLHFCRLMHSIYFSPHFFPLELFFDVLQLNAHFSLENTERESRCRFLYFISIIGVLPLIWIILGSFYYFSVDLGLQMVWIS